MYGSDIEVWITAFNPHNPNVLYSGGDDASFKAWDLRTDSGSSESSALFQKKLTHTMGVCSIQGNPHAPHFIAVGSYDESVSIWDDRLMRTPLHVIQTGGGVWRLKWHPLASYSVRYAIYRWLGMIKLTFVPQSYLLAACMHNGFQILDVDVPNFTRNPISVTKYDEQKSLAYGVDWWYDKATLASNEPIIGSCSFYDHSFHLWRGDLLGNETSSE